MTPIILDIETLGLPDASTYLEPAKAPDNYKDPIKIAAYIEEAQQKQLEQAALDVDLGRILCIGVSQLGHATRVYCLKDHTEADMLERLWDLWRATEDPTLVTYAGLQFDVPFLLRRSLYLSVRAPYLQCDRFRHPQVIDLMAILSMDGKLRARGLQFYLSRFGYAQGGSDITGADVAACYAAGDWAAIEQHCKMDVNATKWLAERIGAILRPASIGQAVGF